MHNYLRIFLITLWLCEPFASGQRPLLNHTLNSLPAQPGESAANSVHKYSTFRNGRDLLIPTTPKTPLFDHDFFHEFDMEEEPTTRRPPGRRGGGVSTGRRREQQGMPRRYAERPKIAPSSLDMLKKEILKPNSAMMPAPVMYQNGLDGSPPYSGYHTGIASDPNSSIPGMPPYPLQLPPDKNFLYSGPLRRPKTALSELKKMSRLQKTDLGQSDDPMRRIVDDDNKPYDDPMQRIKSMLKATEPIVNPYGSQTDLIQPSEIEDNLGVKCTFETPCAWDWEKNLTDGFHVTNGIELRENNMTGMVPGPLADFWNDATAHFLYARVLPSTTQLNLTSPLFSTTMEKCHLEVWMHQSQLSNGLSRVVIEPLHSQESSWIISEIVGNNFKTWEPKIYRIGRISQDFRIAFEIVPNLKGVQRGHVAIDNLRMVNCFPQLTKSEKCSTSQVKCMANKVPVCIPLPRICDIARDCADSEDEQLNCDKIPYGGRCDFETDWCGWRDSGKTTLSWTRHSGSSPTVDTGPEGDHTYQNMSGNYMLVNMNQHVNNSDKKALIGFASNAVMISKIFNPPPTVHGNPNSPYRNCCVVRFYYHQFGKNPGSINMSVVEIREKENVTTTLWWSSKNQGQDWLRFEHVLPNITDRYYLQFEARMGMRIFSDVAIDDFSLSPECFGLNIPKEHLNGYNYWDILKNVKSPTHKDFEQKNYWELSTCGARGMIGPTANQCESFYRDNNKSHVLQNVKVIEDQPSFKGMQMWKVPNEGYYTIIAKGAGGGLGSGGVGSSRGATAISVLELHKNEDIYILVGQQGEHACIKSMGMSEESCQSNESPLRDLQLYTSKAQMVKSLVNGKNGAGGGGGGSFVFLLNSAKNEAVPIVVAGGGGGLGLGQYFDEDFQHGRKQYPDQMSVSGQIHGEAVRVKTAGPGGGWKAKADTALNPRSGAALLQGGRGGAPCYAETTENGIPEKMFGQGGFGGGGGGCDTGGGGGGYGGGDVYLNETNGEGGTSYISVSRSLRNYNSIEEGANSGPGYVIIIPAIEGCGCDYRCIALDEYRSQTQCICPDGWSLMKDNNTACEINALTLSAFQHVTYFFVFLTCLLMVALTWLILILYNRYQRKKQATLRHKMLIEQDLQLSRLRQNADDPLALSNFNPNYGCDGIAHGHIDVRHLPQVARESLRLVKALGQGAFGEVYQALYRHRDGDTIEMPVAVKTLPEMSTGQAEADFLMEAAIMAKFNHPNIVHIIGVCFDRHPRFIVLELLAGGDLKNFLREGRNKPERPSPLTMKDLVFCALDVAKGCRYMESKRFIHRDIAARNCLLSSKGPGRVVKIADFGMARDIYRSDYYRKEGKAMLPIKWMPPEAFLDAIFTAKTDVWSFGVLLWEVFSLGLMPYTGLPNRDIMQLVTSGGRLDAPVDCPPAIYKIMADCWDPIPTNRPNFSEIHDQLVACTREPEIMNAPLPNIFRPPSSERDQNTLIRPQGNEEFCLQVPNSSDYLIPLPGPRSIAERLMSEGAGITIPETMTTCTPPVVTSPSIPVQTDENGCWETSFIMPNSSSDQPLIDPAHRTPNGIAETHTTTTATNTISSAYSTTGAATAAAANANHRSPAIQRNGEIETKLISLDTPQPTPTTIKPPVSFGQLDGITLDPAALPNGHIGATSKSYANIQMSNDHHKMNGSAVSNGSYDGSSNSTISANSAPFTIQGYNDRYAKENHSEISC